MGFWQYIRVQRSRLTGPRLHFVGYGEQPCNLHRLRFRLWGFDSLGCRRSTLHKPRCWRFHPPGRISRHWHGRLHTRSLDRQPAECRGEIGTVVTMLNSSTVHRTVLVSQAVAHAGFNRRRAHAASTRVTVRQSDGQDILGSVHVAVVHCSARRTSPLPNMASSAQPNPTTAAHRTSRRASDGAESQATNTEMANTSTCPGMWSGPLV
jgi:hypothetical protein